MTLAFREICKKFVVAVNYSPLPSVLTVAVFTEGVEVAAYQGNNTLWRSSGYPWCSFPGPWGSASLKASKDFLSLSGFLAELLKTAQETKSHRCFCKTHPLLLCGNSPWALSPHGVPAVVLPGWLPPAARRATAQQQSRCDTQPTTPSCMASVSSLWNGWREQLHSQNGALSLLGRQHCSQVKPRHTALGTCCQAVFCTEMWQLLKQPSSTDIVRNVQGKSVCIQKLNSDCIWKNSMELSKHRKKQNFPTHAMWHGVFSRQLCSMTSTNICSYTISCSTWNGHTAFTDRTRMSASSWSPLHPPLLPGSGMGPGSSPACLQELAAAPHPAGRGTVESCGAAHSTAWGHSMAQAPHSAAWLLQPQGWI